MVTQVPTYRPVRNASYRNGVPNVPLELDPIFYEFRAGGPTLPRPFVNVEEDLLLAAARTHEISVDKLASLARLSSNREYAHPVIELWCWEDVGTLHMLKTFLTTYGSPSRYYGSVATSMTTEGNDFEVPALWGITVWFAGTSKFMGVATGTYVTLQMLMNFCVDTNFGLVQYDEFALKPE